jgi:hypothetical protein
MNLKALDSWISILELEFEEPPDSFRCRYVSGIEVIGNFIDFAGRLIAIDICL